MQPRLLFTLLLRSKKKIHIIIHKLLTTLQQLFYLHLTTFYLPIIDIWNSTDIFLTKCSPHTNQVGWDGYIDVWERNPCSIMRICRIDCESVPKISRSRAGRGVVSCLSISSFLEMEYDRNKDDLPLRTWYGCESLNWWTRNIKLQQYTAASNSKWYIAEAILSSDTNILASLEYLFIPSTSTMKYRGKIY